ncbi:hypothetical protein AAMO2058_000499600 [Amorphochlora amoebiformis]
MEQKLAAIDANMKIADSKKTDVSDEKHADAKMVAHNGLDEDDIYSKNMFNFSNRASQVSSKPMRSKEIATKMPPAVKFSQSVYQWNIYDRYVEEAKKNIARRLANGKGSRVTHRKKVISVFENFSYGVLMGSQHQTKQKVLTYNGSEDTLARNRIMNNPKAKLLASMLDRIVVQNAKSSAFMKFKYKTKNDNRDLVGESKKRGSFEHLFTCTFSEAKNKTVTALCWNHKYLDMFAVGYGSYEFMSMHVKGIICIFSLKNTAYPSYLFRLNSGVMCLDFHPTYSNLLACGMYDGTVAVFDITTKSGKPIFIADDPKKKHWEPVWQVRWKKTVHGKPNSFTSISSDGRIVDWVMAKTELVNLEVMTIKAKEKLEDEEDLDGEDDDDDDAEANAELAGGTCFDVNSGGDLYVCGTDEGALRIYAKHFDTECLEKFEGHHHHIYKCQWNKFHSSVFLTCSEDWHVKIWHTDCTQPVMSYNVGKSVGDVQWAPYSSTVFACVSNDNYLRLYDLATDKHEPIGEQQVLRKTKHKNAKLTHLAFNPRDPVILVGDERGVVQIFKLSPNLRNISASSIDKLVDRVEYDKLSKYLIFKKTNKHRKRDVGRKKKEMKLKATE